MKRAAEAETLDIEELLITAYRRHTVDRVSAKGILAIRSPSLSGVSPTAMVMAHVARGAAIDTSRAGATLAGRATQMRAVEDDLIDVHGAVLDLPQFYAQLTGGTGFVVWDPKSLEAARTNGWDVIQDGSPERPSYRLATLRHDGQSAPGPRAFRNGVLVPAIGAAPMGEARAVALHRIDPIVQLVMNGRARTRPCVSPLVVTHQSPRYAGRRKVVGYDPVYETAAHAIALERATYAVWHCALGLLVDQLQDLDFYRVTGPSAPAAPWLVEEAEGSDGCVA